LDDHLSQQPHFATVAGFVVNGVNDLATNCVMAALRERRIKLCRFQLAKRRSQSPMLRNQLLNNESQLWPAIAMGVLRFAVPAKQLEPSGRSDWVDPKHLTTKPFNHHVAMTGVPAHRIV
jgi:hypothetical protein